MKEREAKVAKRFGVYDRVKSLEDALLTIDEIVEVEFSLDGFWDNIMQVIIVPKYNIPVRLPDYFEVRRRVMSRILNMARDFDLHPSGDTIEDYGEHWYIVRRCGKSWKLAEKKEV